MADDVQAARAELARAMARAEELAAGDAAGTDLVPARSPDPVEAKRQIARVRADMLRQQEVVKRAAEKVEQAMKRELEAARRVLAPMERMVESLQQGMFSINLYLGRDEDIVLLRDGESAPAQTPIALRQMLLFMDEEMAAASPAGGIMPTDVEAFDEWLLADSAHLDQVLPETKGIVALRPRRKEPRDGYQHGEAEANRRTYWLVRNGERLYRTVTLLELDDRVLPHADEIEGLFMRRREGGDLEAMAPGSHEWERALERAERAERTYLRVGLVLEGLLHRTPIFHPLPEAGVSFLDPRFVASGAVWYIADADGLLGTGAESFADWRARLVGELEPGMRIVLGLGLHEHNFERREGNARLSPAVANLPEHGAVYTVEERGRGRSSVFEQTRTQFVFRYHEGERWVGGGRWGGGELREPKRRASCTVYVSDEFILPFDGASVEDMQRFLRSRTDRHRYAEMFPILKAAIEAKHREAEAEEPFRAMLVGLLSRENGVSFERAQRDVGDVVEWWKTKNRRHRPLLLEAERPAPAPAPRGRASSSELGMRGREAQREALREVAAARSRTRDATEAREQERVSKLAIEMIVAEHARRLADERRPVDEGVLAALRAEHPERLAIARPRGRGYFVLLPAEGAKNVYIHEVEYSARGEERERREWVLPRLASVKQWLMIEESERWAAWDFTADEAAHLRGPERDRIRELAGEWFREFGDALVVAVNGEGSKVAVWRYEGRPEISADRPLTQPPTGLKVEKLTGTWRRSAGVVSLRRRSDGETQRLGRDDKRMPWNELTYDRRPENRRRAWEVLARDRQMIALVERDLAAYGTAEAERHRLHVRTSLLTDSVEAQWLRRAWAAERARFDDDFGDVALWPAHRKSMERHVMFPWRLARYQGACDDEPVLWDAVARFVEAGEDPEGRTVADVLAEATRRWVVPSEPRVVHVQDGSGGWALETREVTGAFTAPEELHDFVLSTYVFEHEPDPVADEAPGADVEELADAMLAGVRDAIVDEVQEAEFDVDGDAVEVLATIEEGGEDDR